MGLSTVAIIMQVGVSKRILFVLMLLVSFASSQLESHDHRQYNDIRSVGLTACTHTSHVTHICSICLTQLPTRTFVQSKVRELVQQTGIINILSNTICPKFSQQTQSFYLSRAPPLV